jgi:hypothetical protein
MTSVKLQGMEEEDTEWGGLFEKSSAAVGDKLSTTNVSLRGT